MSQYLLSTYATKQDAAPGAPRTPEEVQRFMEEVAALEEEMEASGTFVFGGALHSADTATVLRPSPADVVMTDGPFMESKEHLAGFYIIDASDLDAALVWAGKVAAAIGSSIEVRPFQHTGRVRA